MKNNKSSKDLTRRKMYYQDELQLLAESIISLKNTGESLKFLKSLLTTQELRILSRRIKIAQLLCNSRTFREILFELDDVGMDTVTKVSYRLASSDIFEIIFKRLK